MTSAVQQDLVPPFRVTPTDADKLQWELCFHPDQGKVDFVGSRTNFKAGMVLIISHFHHLAGAVRFAQFSLGPWPAVFSVSVS